FIVYPTHGIGQIKEINKEKIANFELECYVVEFKKEKLVMSVPVKQAVKSGMRKLSTRDEIEQVFDILKSGVKKTKGMWSRRAQEYEEKINTGDIVSIAEVLRDLTRDVDDADRSYSERIKYETATEQVEPVKIVIPHPNDILNIEEIKTLEYYIKPGDNLFTILLDLGIDNNQATDALSKLQKVYNLRYIKVGQKIILKYRVKLEETELIDSKTNAVKEFKTLEEIVLKISPEKNLVVARQEDGSYETEDVEKELTKYLVKYKGEIEISLFEDAMKIGVSPNVMMEMILLYSFDVDFQRDIRKGDKFEILYEIFYNEEGEKIRDGNILFASLKLRGEDLSMYRYVTENGRPLYFDENGKSIRKSLMATPINGARISSGYGMRKHPVLGYSKMHRGKDFAAPIGTPFFAAGDGVITIRKRWSTWGNYIRIRHNNEYSTEYAHISRFAKRIKVGSRVKQGQVIAYVGNTGRSTGPHLHYGVLYRGKRINPNRVKPVPSIKLKGSKLQDFLQNKEKVEKYRLNTPLQNKNMYSLQS
ncbi:peptidoglycan DD-metalloendopeptidase family protein, partial [Pseudomonadota bacterium]